MKAPQAIDILKNNSVFWSKLGFCHDPVRLDKNGKPIVFFDDFERFAKYHRDFTAAGINIHTSILFNGWVGVDKYNYELTDQVLDSIFRDNENIWYIPRIKLNVPLDWGKSYPEDICVYYDGPRETEEIRKLVGTPKHDILGYESAVGYYTAGAWKDDRPNIGGLISNQSFSSKKWLADAGETLTRLIKHLESGPYGKRILGYHIAYGVSGESCLWGRFGNPVKFADYGVNNRKEFFRWGMNKYKSLEQLRKVWKDENLCEQNCEPPPPALRENCIEKADDFLRMDSKYRICIDYDRFMGEVNATALENFCRIAKEASGGKAAGGFYGYFLSVARSAYTGHLEIGRLLNSPYVDFIAAPKLYYRCAPGEPGGVLGPAQSFNRKKLWLDELDNRTHLCTTAEGVCKNFNETRSVMWREFAKNMAHGSGMWWMDLGGGWFDDPQILAEIKKIEAVRHQLSLQRAASVSEILLIVDEEAFYRFNADIQFHKLLFKEFVCEFHLCGAPIDIYRHKDLPDLDLKQYKLICFTDPFDFNGCEWDKMKKSITPGTTLMWNYYCPDIEYISGMKIAERPMLPDGELHYHNGEKIPYKDLQFPMFQLQDNDNIQILARYAGGAAAVAMSQNEGFRHIFCALPALRAGQLRMIAQEAGCHMYAPEQCTVYADSRFIGVFPRIDIDSSLTLKAPADLTDAGDGVTFHQVRQQILQIPAKSHRFFICK